MLLLALPVVFVVGRVLLFLQAYAPSNVLIAHVRATPPRWRTVTVLMALACTLICAAEFVSVTVEAGAPDWLHLVAVVLAWDAIKIGWLSILSCIRRVIYGAWEVARRLT